MTLVRAPLVCVRECVVCVSAYVSVTGCRMGVAAHVFVKDTVTQILSSSSLCRCILSVHCALQGPFPQVRYSVRACVLIKCVCVCVCGRARLLSAGTRPSVKRSVKSGGGLWSSLTSMLWAEDEPENTVNPTIVSAFRCARVCVRVRVRDGVLVRLGGTGIVSRCCCPRTCLCG